VLLLSAKTLFHGAEQGLERAGNQRIKYRLERLIALLALGAVIGSVDDA
jgi:hypothetical protein